uniref:Uncharacterized protein n=1 Tax=Oryza rufipogon TaxID=4529 RepID=A0A0E0NA69_ORYRU
MTLMPVSCWKKGMSTANASCGLYLPPKKSSRHGCATALLSSLAVVRSSNSARTSSTPRILASVARAASPSPRAMSDTGVSGMASDPSAITAAGTVPNASPTRHPHPPAIFDVQYVVRLADRIPTVIISWNSMFSIPRCCAGAISDMYSGDRCHMTTYVDADADADAEEEAAGEENDEVEGDGAEDGADEATAATKRVHLRPKARDIGEAKMPATMAERKSDEPNSVSTWLSSLQYWFVITRSCCCSKITGKNIAKNDSVDVNPAAMDEH